MSLNMTGQVGELRAGYQVAARLGRWTFDGARLEASVVEANGLWLESGARLDLRLTVGKRLWIWRGVTVHGSSTPLVVRVSGSPETRDA